MRELPVAARVYIAAVVVAGAAVLGRNAVGLDVSNPYLFLALLLLSSATSAFKVALPLSASGSVWEMAVEARISGVCRDGG